MNINYEFLEENYKKNGYTPLGKYFEDFRSQK